MFRQDETDKKAGSKSHSGDHQEVFKIKLEHHTNASGWFNFFSRSCFLNHATIFLRCSGVLNGQRHAAIVRPDGCIFMCSSP